MIKFNSTLAFILLFIIVTISSGIVSALKGYTLGYEALKEISQPKVKPSPKQLAGSNSPASNQQPTAIVAEAEILRQVNALINRDPDQAASTPLAVEKTSSSAANDDSFIESP